MRAINLILSLAFFCVEKKGNIFLFSSVSSISSNYRHRKSTESGSFQPSPAQGFISGLEKKTKKLPVILPTSHKATKNTETETYTENNK